MLIRGRQARGVEIKPSKKGAWYSIEAAANGAAVIRIYDEIGWWGVTAEQFADELSQLEASVINLHINSPGGDVFDGHAIYNALKQHPARVVTRIDALAASIASVIALAGDEVHMAANALFMIHNPWTFAMGDADDMRKHAEILDKVGGTIAQTYKAKTGKSADEIAAWMAAETWFNADEAIEAGFVDEKFGDEAEEDQAAQAGFDLSIFNNAPGLADTQEGDPAEADDQTELIAARARLTRLLSLAEAEL